MTCSTRISTMASLPARPSPYPRTAGAAHTAGAVSKKSGTQTARSTGRSIIRYLFNPFKRTIPSDYCGINNGRDFSLPFYLSIAFLFSHKIFHTLQAPAPFPISAPPSVLSRNLHTPPSHSSLLPYKISRFTTKQQIQKIFYFPFPLFAFNRILL